MCKQCGDPIPALRTAQAIFCSPLCKRRDQHQREKLSPKQAEPCPIEGCGSAIFARGICAKHYTRLRSKGTLDDVRKNARGTCTQEGCERDHLARGLCDAHYRNERRTKRRKLLSLELADRTCMNCDGPIAATRKSTALFCSRACKEKEWAASDYSRRYHFGKQYGLTPDQVDEMAQGGCKICGTVEWAGRHNRPHVDHDHKTGAVRGILCWECNTGLGKFRDDPATLERAIAYLLKAERARESHTVLP